MQTVDVKCLGVLASLSVFFKSCAGIYCDLGIFHRSFELETSNCCVRGFN